MSSASDAGWGAGLKSLGGFLTDYAKMRMTQKQVIEMEDRADRRWRERFELEKASTRQAQEEAEERARSRYEYEMKLKARGDAPKRSDDIVPAAGGGFERVYRSGRVNPDSLNYEETETARVPYSPQVKAHWTEREGDNEVSYRQDEFGRTVRSSVGSTWSPRQRTAPLMSGTPKRGASTTGDLRKEAQAIYKSFEDEDAWPAAVIAEEAKKRGVPVTYEEPSGWFGGGGKKPTGPEKLALSTVLAREALGLPKEQAGAKDSPQQGFGGLMDLGTKQGKKAGSRVNAGYSRDNPLDASSTSERPPSGTWVRLPSGKVMQVP